jgi:hypothetical protein
MITSPTYHLKAGNCAVACYNQEAIGELIQVDDEYRVTTYLAPIGNLHSRTTP